MVGSEIMVVLHGMVSNNNGNVWGIKDKPIKILFLKVPLIVVDRTILFLHYVVVNSLCSTLILIIKPNFLENLSKIIVIEKNDERKVDQPILFPELLVTVRLII